MQSSKKPHHYVINVISYLFIFLIFPIVLFWVGYGQIHPLFHGEFTQQLGSIEVSYIQMAKFIEHSLPNFAWQPRWYFGYPMYILYTPLVPFFEFLTHQLIGWSFGHGYRFLTATAFAGGLITLYLFARTLFKNSVAGFLSALMYGIVPSIIALLYSEVGADRFADKIIDPRRFTILVRWGEGPHIVSLLFLPLAALCLIQFLRHGNKWQLILGSIFTALVLLTNSVGAWGLFLLSSSLVVGELTERTKLWKTIISRALMFALGSFGWSAFWFNPLFLSSFFKEGGGALSYWRDLFPWGWLLVIGIFLIYFFIAKKLIARFAGGAATLLFFIIIFGLVNTYYSSGSERIELVPQVLRLNTEVDIGFSLLIGFGVAAIGYILRKKDTVVFTGGMIAILIMVGIPLGLRQLKLATELPTFTVSAEKAGVDLTKTAEYEVAQNLASKIHSGERAFVPGNYGFYLNYFTDVPQLRGALFQSSIHPWPDHIYYQITNGNDLSISLDWLKIANVGWFVYSGPRNIYQDFKDKHDRFDGILEFVEEKSGDRYYRVPLKDASLAKSVPQAILAVATPKNAIDAEPITAYVNYLEEASNHLTYKEEENGVYTISGSIDDGKVILVQQAYTPGWGAKDNLGRTLEVKKDPLGFTIIKPKTTGTQTITLTHHVTWRIWSGWLLTAIIILISIFMLVRIKKPIFTNTIDPKPEVAAEDE